MKKKLTDTKSEPAKKLLQFLQEAEVDKDYSFIAPVPLSKAESFVHRMRVQLSRYRNKVKQRGRSPRHFKVRFVEAKTNGIGTCVITLRKTFSGEDVSDELNEVWESLDGGAQLNG